MPSFAGGLARRNLQSPSTSTSMSPMNQNYSMNGKIIVSALAILFFIVFVIVLLHLYAKWLRVSCSIGSHSHHAQDTPLTGGLDREVVEALPVFTYGSPCLSKVTKASDAVECVVCLSGFQQDETCKLLPICKHFFHIECINMWFMSHTTCPVCRTAADPHSECGEVHDGASGSAMSCCFTKQDELGEHHQRFIVPVLGSRADIACNSRKDTPSRCHSFSPQLSPASLRNYRRSKSEKFSLSTQGTPLPTNVLLWVNHTHMTTRVNCTHWQSGGRSFPHTTTDTLNPQESLAEDSCCPALPGSPKLCSNLSHPAHRPVVNSLH